MDISLALFTDETRATLDGPDNWANGCHILSKSIKIGSQNVDGLKAIIVGLSVLHSYITLVYYSRIHLYVNIHITLVYYTRITLVYHTCI